MPSQIPHYYDQEGSKHFDALADAYAKYWSGFSVEQHGPHYTEVRKEYMKFMKRCAKAGLQAEDGTCLIVGPGFDFTRDRDLNAELVGAQLEDHPRLLIVDFSTAVLADAHRCLTDIETGFHDKTRLIRRDITDGLSWGLHAELAPRIEACDTLEAWAEFISWLVNDFQWKDIRARVADEQSTDTANPGAVEVIEAVPGGDLDFSKWTDGTAPVQFCIGSLNLDGVFSLTEGMFRHKLSERAEEINEEREKVRFIRQGLSSLHTYVVQPGVESLASSFTGNFIEHNPDARMFTTVAENSTYGNELGGFGRAASERLRQGHSVKGVDCVDLARWMLNDSGEVPFGHSHVVAAYESKKKVNGASHVVAHQVVPQQESPPSEPVA